MPEQALLSRVAALPTSIIDDLGHETFLGGLGEPARARILVGSVPIDVPAGEVIFRSEIGANRVGLVVSGVVRTYLQAPDGRRLSVRYGRAGEMVGSLATARTSLSVSAVTDVSMLVLDWDRLLETIAADGRVAVAFLGEVGRRLIDTYATLAANTFGSMRERVALQLLDVAVEDAITGTVIAPVTQQALADGVGTVREVVARVLREFRDEGLVATLPGHIVLLDPVAITTIVSRWRAG